jgi:hypothetical protein
MDEIGPRDLRNIHRNVHQTFDLMLEAFQRNDDKLMCSWMKNSQRWPMSSGSELKFRTELSITPKRCITRSAAAMFSKRHGHDSQHRQHVRIIGVSP